MVPYPPPRETEPRLPARAIQAGPVAANESDERDRTGHAGSRVPIPSAWFLAIGIVLGVTISLAASTIGWVPQGPATPAAAGAPGASSAPVIVERGSLSILSPEAGARVFASPLVVSVVASRPLGRVRVVVATGTAVLGEAEVTVTRAGLVTVTIPLTGTGTADRARVSFVCDGLAGPVVLGTRTVRVCTSCA